MSQRPVVPPRFRLGLVIALSIIAGAHVYVGLRTVPHLAVVPGLELAGWAFLAASTLLIPGSLLSRFFLRGLAADVLAFVGHTVMGFMSFLLVLTVLRDVALGLAGLLVGVSAGVRAESAWAVWLLAALATAIGYVFARRTPRIVEVEVRVEGLDPRLVGLRIAQISDVHVGPTIKRRHFQRMIDRVNALEADLIAVTGDLVDGSVAALREHTAPVGTLKARHGVFFVTGNHEYYAGADAWIHELRRLGLTVLMNEHRVLLHDGASLVLAGVTDFNASHIVLEHKSDPGRAAEGAPAGVFKLLLAHQPRSAFAAVEAGFDLQLSGHTHGGQFWPWNLLVPLQQPFTHGLRRMGRLQIYTSRGTGYWGPPLRLGAPSEITRLTLVGA